MPVMKSWRLVHAKKKDIINASAHDYRFVKWIHVSPDGSSQSEVMHSV